jgi:hypothetical protein
MVSLTGGRPRDLAFGPRLFPRRPGALSRFGSRTDVGRAREPVPGRCLRMEPLRRPAAGVSSPPELPVDATVSVAWRLEGAGRVVGALLPPGHPSAGRLGARVLAGPGVWPATMWPADQELSAEHPLIELFDASARLVVSGPDRAITGTVDQPGRPLAGVGRLARVAAGLRRDSRQVRVRAADRVWWLRAAGVFGVRVSRDDRLLYATRGMVGRFGPAADELDVSVILLVLASLPSSTYAPVLGF